MLIKSFFHKDIHTIASDASIFSLLHQMIDNHHNAFLVVDGDNQPVGIVTVQDIAKAIVPEEFMNNTHLAQALYNEDFFDERCDEVKNKTVADVMRTEFPTVELSDNTLSALAEFLQHDSYFVPVTEGGKIVGIISRSNVKKAIGSAFGIQYIPKHSND